MNHYPHHIGDFDRATRHCSRIERSIYRDLMDMYYDTEKMLPLDLPVICKKILVNSNEESTVVQQVLNEFFLEKKTGWYHTRCDLELKKYYAKKKNNSIAGTASANARASKKQEVKLLECKPTDVEQPLLIGCNEIQPTRTRTRTNKTPKPLTSKRFDEFWKAYPGPRKTDKQKCRGKWEKLNLDLVADEILADVKYKTANFVDWVRDGGASVYAPERYINKRAWEDEFTAPEPVNQSNFMQRPEPYLTKAEIAQRDNGQARMREIMRVTALEREGRETMRLEALKPAGVPEVAQTMSSCSPEHPTTF